MKQQMVRIEVSVNGSQFTERNANAKPVGRDEAIGKLADLTAKHQDTIRKELDAYGMVESGEPGCGNMFFRLAAA